MRLGVAEVSRYLFSYVDRALFIAGMQTTTDRSFACAWLDWRKAIKPDSFGHTLLVSSFYSLTDH